MTLQPSHCMQRRKVVPWDVWTSSWKVQNDWVSGFKSKTRAWCSLARYQVLEDDDWNGQGTRCKIAWGGQGEDRIKDIQRQEEVPWREPPPISARQEAQIVQKYKGMGQISLREYPVQRFIFSIPPHELQGLIFDDSVNWYTQLSLLADLVNPAT